MEDQVLFSDSHGTRLSGFLAEQGKHVVILCHGWRSSKDDPLLSHLQLELYAQNLSTFRFDLYGHGQSDGSLKDITLANATNGIFAAIDMLKQMGFEKVSLFGYSFGGTCSLIAATKEKEIVRLGLLAPASDFLSLKEINLKDAGDYDPIKLAKLITIPVLIVHGSHDDVVPLSQSKKLVTLLHNAILHVLPDVGHGLDDASLETTCALFADFFRD